MFKLFKFKQNKVFTKLNKMNRKQAYTIGAVAVVLIVALILVISSATGEDDSFAGMDARGYDLAQMPFATDEAEQYLLSNVYPDMQENGSSLLYSLQEKEERQEEDERTLDFIDNDEEDDDDTDYTGDSGSSYNSDSSYNSGSSRGYGGYGGYGGRGGGGKTEIGTLSSAGMATSGGGGINSTYGPSGDFHQFKGREDRGDEKPVQLKTNDAKQTLAQFRSGSLAAARLNENKMKNAGKALFGGDIRGSDAFGKDGSVDLSKLQSGGLSLDTSAPSTTTDLNNLDKKVAEAAKNAQDKKKEEKKNSFWTDLWQGLVKDVAGKLIDVATSSLGDALVGARSAFVAGRDFDRSQVGKSFGDLEPAVQKAYMDAKGLEFEYDDKGNITDDSWNKVAQGWAGLTAKQQQQTAHDSEAHNMARNQGAAGAAGYTNASSTKHDNDTNLGHGLDCGGKSPIQEEKTDANGVKTVTYRCP